MPLWVSFALLGVGIVAIYIEIFVPAAGLIGLAGGGAVVAGIVLGYAYHDPLTGSIVLIASLVVTPVAIVTGLKAFPRTRMGRRLILGDPVPAVDDAPRLSPGDDGEALTVLRPSGTARFGSRRVSVVTSGEYVDRDARIRVTRVEGSRIVVRVVRETEQEG